MKLFILVLTTFIFIIPVSADENKLSLESSIRLAIANTTAVLKSQADLELSGANLLKSYAQFLPNLTTQNNYVYTHGSTYYTTGVPSTISGANSQVNLSISSDLNLFNGFADSAAFQASILRKNFADLTLDHVKQQIALDIVQSFLQIILDKKLEAIAAQNLQESQSREELLVAQNRLGAKSPSDMYLQQAETSTAESSLFTIQNKLATDTLILQQKLRLNLRDKVELLDPPLPVEEKVHYSDERELIETALAKRTDLHASEDLLSAANLDVKNAAATYLPAVDLVGSAMSGGDTLYNQTLNGANVMPSSQEDMGTQLANQTRYAVTLNFTWNIFDKLVTYANEAHASNQAYKVKLDSEDLENEVVKEARQALGDYRLAEAQLKSSQKGLFAAQQAYKVMGGRYQVGSASFVDLMTAQDTLVRAESARAEALISFQLQIWTMKYVLGNIFESS